MVFIFKKSRSYWLLKKGRLILGEAYFTFKAVCESKGDFRGSGTDILLTGSLLASRSTIVKYHKMV